MNQVFAADEPLAELHAHLGGGVDAATMWELAHEQGIKLPYRDYWEFSAATNVGAGTDGLAGLDRIYHLTELIQSSPEGVFRAVHGMISGAYRSQRITTHEVRFNPAKRNRGGERDLDAIVMAAVHGVDRADARVPGAGRPDPDDGPHLPARAERGHRRAGDPLPRPRAWSPSTSAARGPAAAGRPTPTATSPRSSPAPATPASGVTLHAGEEGVNAPDPAPYVEEMRQALELGVDRVGHGIIAAMEPRLLELALERGVVLEICPTSNVRTGAVRDEEQMAEIVFGLEAAGVPLVVATDGPEMIGTRLRAEYAMLVRRGALTRAGARAANERGHRVSFIRVGEPSAEPSRERAAG